MDKISDSNAIAIELAEADTAWSQHGCCQHTCDQLGLTAVRLGESDSAPAMILTHKSRSLYYNRIIGLGMAHATTQRQIDDAIEVARHAAVDRLAIDLSPRARPEKIETWLERRGFESEGQSAKLWRDSSRLPPARPIGENDQQIVVHRVAKKYASRWVDVVAQVWSTYGSRRQWFESRVAEHNWAHYLAFFDNDRQTPIAAGALHTATIHLPKPDEQGRDSIKVGHLVDGVSLSPFRRMGAQAAIIRRRVRDGRRAGCELFTSETAPPLPRQPLVSYRILRRQGFDLAYVRQSWVLELRPGQ